MTKRGAAIQAIINKHFPPDTHPYRELERAISHHLRPDQVLLDIGCGATAPVLSKFKGMAKELIGIDVTAFVESDPDLTLINTSVSDMKGVASESIDIAYSRSVMEHVADVDAAFAEVYRVLRPGGRYIFLTPNLWDYASLIALVVPNRFHGWIVRKTEGRAEHDTFPVFYRSNTFGAVRRLAERHRLSILELSYLGQYPSYLMFSPLLFRLGCAYEKFLERHPRLFFLRGWIFCSLLKPSHER